MKPHEVRTLIGPHESTGAINTQFKINSQSYNPEQPRKFKEIKIALFCSGQMLGQEDVINERNYTTSVKCLSAEGALFSIKRQEFIHKLGNDERTWDVILGINT